MMYSVKVTYKGEVRRLQLSVDKSSETYVKLTDTIRSIFPGLTQSFTLTWKDDEDDIVTVSSELELQEAIRVMAYQQGLLKFTVNDAPARPSCRQAADPEGDAHCFRNNRGSCFAPFGLPHPQGPHPYNHFGRRHPCGRGFGGPREALFHLFGRHPAAAPFCPGLGPRFPPAPAFVPPPAAAHEAALFGLPLEAVADFAEALALELSEAIQKGEEERVATSKAGAATAAAPATGSVVHVGVTCDVCGVRPITGPRYKCTVRDNYDVCAACYESQLQPYPMLKIVTNGGVGTVVTPAAPIVRDLNDEDAGLQAAISESYATATTAASVPAADVPPALLSRSTISVTSATVDDNGEGEGGVEDVYSEADYSLVHNTAASATTAEKFSLAADRQAALAAATAAPAVAPPSAAEVWAKELQLLSDMGFTDKQELIPLLQQHIGTPASASVGGATSVEGLQKVVSTLLFR